MPRFWGRGLLEKQARVERGRERETEAVGRVKGGSIKIQVLTGTQQE